MKHSEIRWSCSPIAPPFLLPMNEAYSHQVEISSTGYASRQPKDEYLTESRAPVPRPLNSHGFRPLLMISWSISDFSLSVLNSHGDPRELISLCMELNYEFIINRRHLYCIIYKLCALTGAIIP